MNMVKRKRSTLREVAEYAGVSTATVSLVVNGKATDAGITDSTRHIVLEAIAKLQYTPNRMASAVVTGRSRMVGVVSALSRELFDTQFGSRVLSGFVRGARERGYHFVFLEDIARNSEDHYRVLQDAREMCLEGLILLIDVGRDEKSFDVGKWLSTSIPVVSVQFTYDPEGAPGFRVNHQNAVEDCIEHFVRLGHERIGFAARHIDLRSRSTVAVIEYSLKQRGLSFDPNCVFEVPRWDRIDSFVEAFLMRRPTAMIVLYDGEAVRAITALREAGVQVPRDLSVIGYGDSPLCTDFAPALSTYRPPLEEIGREAMRYLIQCVEADSAPRRDAIQDMTGQLVLRHSTGPAPRA